jgi:hypothetical protein
MRRVKVYQYRVKDPIPGRRYLTRYKLIEEEAAERYPNLVYRRHSLWLVG